MNLVKKKIFIKRIKIKYSSLLNNIFEPLFGVFLLRILGIWPKIWYWLAELPDSTDSWVGTLNFLSLKFLFEIGNWYVFELLLFVLCELGPLRYL